LIFPYSFFLNSPFSVTDHRSSVTLLGLRAVPAAQSGITLGLRFLKPMNGFFLKHQGIFFSFPCPVRQRLLRGRPACTRSGGTSTGGFRPRIHSAGFSSNRFLPCFSLGTFRNPLISQACRHFRPCHRPAFQLPLNLKPENPPRHPGKNARGHEGERS
jgi:hypothetical protein